MKRTGLTAVLVCDNEIGNARSAGSLDQLLDNLATSIEALGVREDEVKFLKEKGPR